MNLFLLSIALLALAFAGIAVKILFKKNGEFAGTCASNNPLLKTKRGNPVEYVVLDQKKNVKRKANSK